MFWGSFDAKGTGRLINVEGMMNSDKYKAVLLTHLLPTMQRDFPDGDGVFEQNIAPFFTKNAHIICRKRINGTRMAWKFS